MSNTQYAIRWVSSSSPRSATDLPSEPSHSRYRLLDETANCDAQGTCRFVVPSFTRSMHYLVQVRTEAPTLVPSFWSTTRHAPPPTPTATPTPMSNSTPTPISTPTPTSTPISSPSSPPPSPATVSTAKILRISPSVRSVTVWTDDLVRLAVDVYGLQDVLDNFLADDVTFDWSVLPIGGSFNETRSPTDADEVADEREVILASPSWPGRYTIRSELGPSECWSTARDRANCVAEFELTVRRPFAPPLPTATPFDPDVPIPEALTDPDGNQCEVFTPLRGGRFDDGVVALHVEPGAVPSGEFIGLCVEVGDLASNEGETAHRAILAGNFYNIYAVDASGDVLSRYFLNAPIEACIPLPAELRSSLPDTVMVRQLNHGDIAILSSSVRFQDDASLSLCGFFTEVPARIAAGKSGAPQTVQAKSLSLTPQAPHTGGNARFNAGLWLLMMSGGALGIMSLILLRARRNEPLG